MSIFHSSFTYFHLPIDFYSRSRFTDAPMQQLQENAHEDLEAALSVLETDKARTLHHAQYAQVEMTREAPDLEYCVDKIEFLPSGLNSLYAVSDAIGRVDNEMPHQERATSLLQALRMNETSQNVQRASFVYDWLARHKLAAEKEIAPESAMAVGRVGNTSLLTTGFSSRLQDFNKLIRPHSVIAGLITSLQQADGIDEVDVPVELQGAVMSVSGSDAQKNLAAFYAFALKDSTNLWVEKEESNPPERLLEFMNDATRTELMQIFTRLPDLEAFNQTQPEISQPDAASVPSASQQ